LVSPSLTAQGSCGAGQPTTQAIARNRPNACFSQSSVNFQPGNIANANDALNVRFDLYPNGSFQNCKNDPLYPPGPNVRTGYVGRISGNSSTVDWCNATPENPVPPAWSSTNPPGSSTTMMGFPLDSNNMPTNIIGNGTWDCTSYWSANHPIALNHPAPTGCTNTASISRYDVYNYEINNGYVSDLSQGKTVTQGQNSRTVKESGALMCSSTPPVADRRFLYVAVVNCKSVGQPLQGAAENVPVAAFAKFFLTLPVPTATSPVYGEFHGIVKPGSTPPAYPVVQLYR
jgi:hypothetical protein